MQHQIHDTVPSGFALANDSQTERFIDTGSVNGASKVCLVRSTEDRYLTHLLGEVSGATTPLVLAYRSRPPREIGDIESVARKDTTDVEVYKREYEAGWRASGRPNASMDAGTSHAWDDGYLDRAAERTKWHLTWCLDHDTCGEG